MEVWGWKHLNKALLKGGSSRMHSGTLPTRPCTSRLQAGEGENINPHFQITLDKYFPVISCNRGVNYLLFSPSGQGRKFSSYLQLNFPRNVTVLLTTHTVMSYKEPQGNITSNKVHSHHDLTASFPPTTMQKIIGKADPAAPLQPESHSFSKSPRRAKILTNLPHQLRLE